MALSFMCGYGIAAYGEDFARSANVPSVFATSAGDDQALSHHAVCNAANGTSWLAYQSRRAGGTLDASFLSVRFLLLVENLHLLTNAIEIWANYDVASGTIKERLLLNTNGTLTLLDSSGANGITSTTAVSSNRGLFTTVELDLGWSAGSGRKLRINGVEEASSTATAAAASTGFKIGCGIITAPANGSTQVNWGNILYDNASFTSSGYPGRGFFKLLLPAADPGALNSWTNGGGGTTSIFEGVNNIPPVGVAASTNGVKIKNAASGSNLDYVATMQAYIAAGVPVGSKINAVMALCNDGEEVTTGTKAGGVWIASNPAQTAGTGTFDYGDDTATVVGTFQTGWRTHRGVVTANPAVTLTTAPTMTVRKTGSTTRVVDVDFMGIYVDYTPPAVLAAVSQPTMAHYHQIMQV